MSSPLAPNPIVHQPRPIRAHDNRTGAALMLIPSASRPNIYHVVSATACDCAGFRWRGRCSHLEAARRELVVPQGRYCEIHERYERCHCPAAKSWCDDCPPLGIRIPLVGRLSA